MIKMKKEVIALYVFIISIIILIALIFSAFQGPGEITGKVISETQEAREGEAGIIEISCSDSENGRDYNTKGTIDYCDKTGCSSQEDSCSGKKLREWYCANIEKKYEEHWCEGECDDGICITVVTDYRYIATGGGGGGGGSSGGTTSPATTTGTGQTYSLGNLNEQQIELYKYDSMRFNLGSVEHTLTLSDNTPTQVIITNSGQTSTLTVGENHELDLDSDTISDIAIRVKSINIINKKINLILRSI